MSASVHERAKVMSESRSPPLAINVLGWIGLLFAIWHLLGTRFVVPLPPAVEAELGSQIIAGEGLGWWILQADFAHRWLTIPLALILLVASAGLLRSQGWSWWLAIGWAGVTLVLESIGLVVLTVTYGWILIRHAMLEVPLDGFWSIQAVARVLLDLGKIAFAALLLYTVTRLSMQSALNQQTSEITE